MAKSKTLEPVIAYRVKTGGDCTIFGKTYLPGELLPSGLTIDQINHHLPFCETVKVERESTPQKPELTPEETVEIMEQENGSL
jgi:hypothetical protein